MAYLLENGIDPRNILLLTFTNKAARQMLDRVTNLLPVDASGIWGGTFHSIGNRVLRRHGSALGYNSAFTIMDREDQKDLINTVVANAGIAPTAPTGGPHAPWQFWRPRSHGVPQPSAGMAPRARSGESWRTATLPVSRS